jgi:hypothetical protein
VTTRREEAWTRWAVGLVLLLSIGLGLTFLWRSQVGGDQLNLLARGWLWATRGELVPYGNPASGGGASPGSVTSVVVGLPLFLWLDARSPILLVLLSQIVAFLLLDRLVAQCWGRPARLCFALLYGLSPLRLALSGLLWNPCYLFFVAALHAWTSFRQRERPRAVDTFVQVFVLGLAVQLHLSAAMLCLASVLLWWRGTLRVHWGGAAAGVAATFLTLVPYLEALAGGRIEVPANTGFLGRGLLYVYPLAHGLSNSLRAASLSLPSKLTRFDFTGIAGASGDAVLVPLVFLLAKLLAPLTLVASLVAAVRFGRRIRRSGRLWQRGPAPNERVWLTDYALCCFAAALVLFCAAPTTPMWWQSVVLMHALVLPLTWLGALAWRSRQRWQARSLALAWAGLSALLAVALAFGAPPFRCGGRSPVNMALAEPYPMLDELGIQERCPFPIFPDTWVPDLFAKPEGGVGGPPGDASP